MFTRQLTAVVNDNVVRFLAVRERGDHSLNRFIGPILWEGCVFHNEGALCAKMHRQVWLSAPTHRLYVQRVERLERHGVNVDLLVCNGDVLARSVPAAHHFVNGYVTCDLPWDRYGRRRSCRSWRFDRVCIRVWRFLSKVYLVRASFGIS